MRLFVMAILVLIWPHLAAAETDVPSFNTNDWNLVLVPSFEVPNGTADPANNNLSVTGLNHSLRFGQMLKGLTSGKETQIKQILALTNADRPDDMAPLESIEPFALLNNRAVSVQSVKTGDPSAYNSPAALVGDIIGNRERGIYVLAGPADIVQEVAEAFVGASALLQTDADYLVLSGAASSLTLNAYEDGIEADAVYPVIPLPPLTESCPNPPVTVTAPAPKSLIPYTSQTVYLVRHVEAHPTASFENGNYVCQGQWRALGATKILNQIMGGKPDYVFSSNPDNIIGCSGTCSYVRPALTVAPFAIQYGLPLTLAAFQWNDPEDLARALFDRASPYFAHPASGSKILVGWEHGNLEKAVIELFTDVYENPKAAAKLPPWPYTDYDSVWILSTDANGSLTFRNSCEHIPTTSLPSVCPSFWQ